VVRRARVVIDGAGPAGTTLAWLLLERGADVRLHGRRPQPGRIVAVSRETLALAAELWRVAPERIAAGTWLTRRRTAWSAPSLESSPAAALACDAGHLAARFLQVLAARGLELRDEAAEQDCDWMVHAGGRPAAADACSAGLRVARAGWMPGIPSGDSASMTVAATAGGWLFGCPHPDGGFALVVVQPPPCDAGGAADALQAAVDTVWPGCGERVEPRGGPQPCAPLLAHPPAPRSVLRVGDAALALDALRGDGFGYAIRGALLAQAAIVAEDPPAARRHYWGRLREVFRAHLRNCIGHYRAAWNAALWTDELARMTAAMDSLGPAYVAEQHLHGRDLRAARPLSQHESREETA
jgi:hypothetical protein